MLGLLFAERVLDDIIITDSDIIREFRKQSKSLSTDMAIIETAYALDVSISRVKLVLIRNWYIV